MKPSRAIRTVLGSVFPVALASITMCQGALAANAGVLELQGRGVQIYRCTSSATGTAWVLLGPDATLTDTTGRPVGHHSIGPSWQAADGSIVVGELLASGSPAIPGTPATAAPWLVLRATSHAGAGRFDAVTYVTRTRTAGGTAPTTGCDTAHVAAEVRVYYSATYTLFGAR